MEFTKPVKLPDGRYFLKINGVRRQVNDVVLQDTLDSKTVNFKLEADQETFQSIDNEILTRCDVMLELSGLWFLKKSFGPIWRVIQVRVRGAPKAPDFPKEYLFTDDPADEDDPADYVD